MRRTDRIEPDQPEPDPWEWGPEVYLLLIDSGAPIATRPRPIPRAADPEPADLDPEPADLDPEPADLDPEPLTVGELVREIGPPRRQPNTPRQALASAERALARWIEQRDKARAKVRYWRREVSKRRRRAAK